MTNYAISFPFAGASFISFEETVAPFFTNIFSSSILFCRPIPLQLQWVEAKREHPTSLIFMKGHRFYEVFHKDADVVVEELSNCIYMFGRTAHTGFPESCLERFTDELSEKGYDIIVI